MRTNKQEGPLELAAAREKALSMLEHRAYTRRELTDKLRRFTDEETADTVADQLEGVGLIDDGAYALQFAHDLMEARLPGPVKLKIELARRGIDDDTAACAVEMAEAEFGGPEERLRKLIGARYKRLLGDERGRKKAADSLFRLGYKYDMIKSAINEALDGCELEDEFSDGTI